MIKTFLCMVLGIHYWKKDLKVNDRGNFQDTMSCEVCSIHLDDYIDGLNRR